MTADWKSVVHTHPVSVAEEQPSCSAPATRQEEAHAETPATLVVAAPAEEVWDAWDPESAELDPGDEDPDVAVSVALDSAAVVEAPLQVDDWRARAAVTSAVPHESRHEVTADWNAVVQTHPVSVAEEQPSCSAPATRQAEAQAETPATDVWVAPADEV